MCFRSAINSSYTISEKTRWYKKGAQDYKWSIPELTHTLPMAKMDNTLCIIILRCFIVILRDEINNEKMEMEWLE